MLSDCSALTESLSGHHLLDEAALGETLRDLAPRFTDAKKLADELVRRGWLTPYQKELIMAGKAEELILGPYVLLDKIGEGGMGAVYKARHRVLKAVRAIKVIRPDRLVGKGSVERFYREAENVARLHHPNIILAHDAGQHGNVHYFVMEFAPGVDLGQLLQRCGPLPAADACAYIRQAAIGLEHARERDLIHRDIKPSNLLVTPEGQVKLLDLGLARVRLSEETAPEVPLTQDGAVMGTPDYMAPEQAEDSRRVDIRADIYSLGCTLYHVLTGRPPFPGGSVMEKLIKHRLEEPRALEALRADIPAGLGNIVRKMMAKDAAARYRTPAEVAAALEPYGFGAGRPGVSHPDQLAGTLLPGMVGPLPTNPGAVQTPIPDSAMEHTDASGQWDESAATAAYIGRGVFRGPTERLSGHAGTLQPTEFPTRGEGGGVPTGLPGRDKAGLQATQLLSEGESQAGRLPPTAGRGGGRGAGRGVLVAVVLLALLGAGAVGAFFLLPRPSTAPRESDDRLADLKRTTPPTGSETKDATPRPEETSKGPQADPARPQPQPEPVVPPGPPARAVAKPLSGDRSELSLLRTRGPLVRTGGRGLAWARRRELYTLAPHKGRRAAFSADGSRAVFSTPADQILMYGLRDIQPGTVISLGDLTQNLTDGSSHVNAVGQSADGNRVLIATVGRSEKSLEGNAITTKYNMLITFGSDGATELVYGPRLDLSAGFGCMASSPEGTEVLVGGVVPLIYRWKPGARDSRLTSRRYFKHATGDVVTALTYSPDGRFAASAGVDRLVCVYNAAKADSTAVATLGGMPTTPLSVALSAAGRYALCGGREGKACLWEVGDEPGATIAKPTSVLDWHAKDAAVTAVTFAPSGRVFLTGSDDGTVCLGEIGKDKPVWIEAPRGGGPILALSISADGRNVIVADEAGLGEYPLVRDVVAKSKPAVIGADADVAPAEAKGR
jgi:serine/threonine-protein kinase